MLQHVLFAAGLVAVTVAVHAAGFGLVLGTLIKRNVGMPSRPWPITWFLVRLAWLLMLIHVVEICVWALFYRWQHCLPDAESAFYFSGVTYTTLGYGDVLLPQEWRLLAPLQALTGILMCGLSAGLFFATVTAIYTSADRRQAPEPTNSQLRLDKAKAEVEAMIARLSSPLADADVKAGWNPALQKKWQQVFQRIRSELSAGTRPRWHDVNMGYGLATFGVEEGPLAFEIVRVGTILQAIAVN